MIGRATYKNKGGSTCCHCALKVKGVGTADGSPLVGTADDKAAAPAPKPSVTFVGGSGSPDACNDGDFEVPTDNGCYITACVDALKKQGKDPSKVCGC